MDMGMCVHVCVCRGGGDNIREGDPHGSRAPRVTCGAVKSRPASSPDDLSARPSGACLDHSWAVHLGQLAPTTLPQCRLVSNSRSAGLSLSLWPFALWASLSLCVSPSLSPCVSPSSPSQGVLSFSSPSPGLAWVRASVCRGMGIACGHFTAPVSDWGCGGLCGSASGAGAACGMDQRQTGSGGRRACHVLGILPGHPIPPPPVAQGTGPTTKFMQSTCPLHLRHALSAEAGVHWKAPPPPPPPGPWPTAQPLSP